MKKPFRNEIEDDMLEEMNSFMKKFKIEEVKFKSHGVKKSKGKKAESYWDKPKSKRRR